MKVNLQTAVPLVLQAIEENLSSFRQAPDSSGQALDDWEEQDEAVQNLSEALEEFSEAFYSCTEVRPSLARKNISIPK